MSRVPTLVITYLLQNKFIDTQRDEIQELDGGSGCTVSPASTLNNIGSHESQRLMRGLKSFLTWVRVQNAEELSVIHVVDDSQVCSDPERNAFANQLVLDLEQGIEQRGNEEILSCSSISAFCGTRLQDIIANRFELFLNHSNDHPRISVVGVHSDSNIHYLMYDLCARYPGVKLATCSALTAARSRTQHFSALGQMHKLLGVEVYDSLYDFENFILPSENRVTPTLSEESMVSFNCKEGLQLNANADTLACGIMWSTIGEDKEKITDIDKEIICELYRGSTEVRLKKLSGGFSGSWVFTVCSKDEYGHTQSTTVLKVGRRLPIVKERVNFEKVEDIMGNNAPRLIGSSEYGDRAGIKFAYASMIEEDEDNTPETRSFRSIYLEGVCIEKLRAILNQTFLKVLNRFYIAAKLQVFDLFRAYDFDGKGWNWKIGGSDTPSVVASEIKEFFAPLNEAFALDVDSYQDRTIQAKRKHDEITGYEKFLVFPGDFTLPNVTVFLEHRLPSIKEGYLSRVQHYVSYVHGDLNGRNIILDHAFNVWLIDFEYTRRTHILLDVAKLENDVLYEYTTIDSLEMLKEAFIITRQLLKVRDLAEQLPETLPGLNHPALKKAWDIVLVLRNITKQIVKDDRSAFQMEVALLRMALFTMSLSHLSSLQKVWALAGACGFAYNIEERANRNKEYRLDFVALDKSEDSAAGKLAISILPGRKDHQRSLEDDIGVIKEHKIKKLMCLCTQFEVENESLETLRKALGKEGVDSLLFPIPKGVVPSFTVAKHLCEWLVDAIDHHQENALLVSKSGLGRPGVLAACLIIYRDLKIEPQTAISLVRNGRGPRALDSEGEVAFINAFYNSLKNEAKNGRHRTMRSSPPVRQQVERRTSSLSKII